MTARDVIAGVLKTCGLGRYKDDFTDDDLLDIADALIAAGVTMPEPPAIPDRAFVDDHGRRWEWCGGVEGTWAWRITALPEPVPPRCTGRVGTRRCILDTGHRGGHF